MVGVGLNLWTPRRKVGGGGQTGPTRLQATRLGINLGKVNSSFAYFNARSFRFARVAMNKTQIILPGFYVNSNVHGFTGASTVSFTASLEYPAGTFNQFKFSGSATGSVASLATITSDVLTLSVPVPKNAMFWIRIFGNWLGALDQGAAQYIPYSQGGFVANGDAMNISTTLPTDMTMGGTIVNTNAAIYGPFLPLGLVGPNPNAAVICWGNSRTIGLGDTIDTSGDMGETARSIGPTLAYANLGDSGEQAYLISNYYNTGTTPSIPFVAIAAYGTVSCIEFGFNDVNSSGETSALVQKHLLLINAMIATHGGMKTYVSTLAQGTTSNNSWIDQAGQTINLNGGQGNIPIQAERFSVNTAIRDGLTTNSLDIGSSSWPGVVAGQVSTVQGFIEMCSVTENVFDTGFWKTDGTANKYTGDGVHESQFANLAIQAAGVVPVATLATYT